MAIEEYGLSLTAGSLLMTYLAFSGQFVRGWHGSYCLLYRRNQEPVCTIQLQVRKLQTPDGLAIASYAIGYGNTIVAAGADKLDRHRIYARPLSGAAGARFGARYDPGSQRNHLALDARHGADIRLLAERGSWSDFSPIAPDRVSSTARRDRSGTRRSRTMVRRTSASRTRLGNCHLLNSMGADER